MSLLDGATEMRLIRAHRQSLSGLLPILRATSGKSSKLEVSSIDLTCTGMAAGLSLMWPQSTPLNQSRLLMSSIHWSLWSLSSQNLEIRIERETGRYSSYLIIVLLAVSDIGTSGGNSSVLFQFITFL